MYQINKTNGEVLTTVLDGTTNTETGLTLIGRNYTNYGDAQNENFIRLLENFANNVPPTEGNAGAFSPLEGMLWWDTGTNKLKVYNGTDFVSVSPIVGSATAPSSPSTGDLWWDTTNQQLKSWTGTGWLLIGPSYTVTQGKSGQFTETFLDDSDVKHTVVVEYVNGEVVSITSGATFTLKTPTYNFSNLFVGVNVPGTTSTGVLKVGGVSTLGGDTTVNARLYTNSILPTATSTYNLGNNTTQFNDIYLSGRAVFTDANISFSNKSLVVHNKNYGGGLEIYVNSLSSGNVKAAHVDGDNGTLSVTSAPAGNLSVTNKLYVDSSIDTAVGVVATGLDATNAQLAMLEAELNGNLSSTTSSLSSQLAAIRADDLLTNSKLTNLQNQVNNNIDNNQTRFASIETSVNNINSTITGLAPLASPSFSGTPFAPTPPANDSSTRISTTAFVAGIAATLAADYNLKIATLSGASGSNLTNSLALKANIASPTFTGIPAAPTPTIGDNSTRLATTAFVTAAVATQKFTYTVSTGSPSGGNNGDFWFQVG